uniref:(northern house mosquito) hypothetical protein n=1 Tax=Culex pipiens TaxID=7175 RepID=A0A8D8NYF6_CULPI
MQQLPTNYCYYYCSRSNKRWTCPAPATARRTTSAGLPGTFKNSDTNLHRKFPVPAVGLSTSSKALILRKLLPEPMSGTRSSPQRRGELSYLGNTARQDWRNPFCTTLTVNGDS